MSTRKINRVQFVAVCGCGCGQPTLLSNQPQKGNRTPVGQPLRFIRNHHNRGDTGHSWRGGRYQDAKGYVWVHAPSHPNADVRGYVAEHRKVMSDCIGRALLPSDIVHHKDENPSNNSLDNLEITTRRWHAKRHATAPQWSRKHVACIDCGTAERPHDSHGRCSRCVKNWRYRTDPEFRGRVLAQQKKASMKGCH